MAKTIAAITGASSGIGEQFARRLAKDGHDLLLIARRRDRLDALGGELAKAHGVSCESLAADLSDRAGIGAVEKRLAGEARLALLVNNAGIGAYMPFVQLDAAMAEQSITLQVLAPTRLTRAALPGMIARKAGGVINVASLLALSGSVPPNPMPNRAVYAGAKSYLLAFSQQLAFELAGSGVVAQVLLPGVVKTEFHQVQKMDLSHIPAMEAKDVVHASLAALAKGETICVPALEDPSALDRIGEAQRAVMGVARSTQMAARYR